MYYYAEKSISINKIFEGTSGIYPNPFSDFLSFSFSDYDGQKIIFELFDLQGRKLISKTVQEGETINAAELNSGIYFYTLDFDGERKSGKLIKQ